ncbi:hypothetical protein AX14_001153 [Amanita brunnescens Koide BX004]|nr:hypothetical protein AX14_001153 [Amanita brunnescens Koide BX004]
MTAGQHHGTQRHHHPSKASFLSPGDQEEDEAPLLYDEQDEQAREHAYRAPFPWFQFSILFALQTAIYLPYNVTRPFTPDLIRSIGIAKGEKDVGYYVGLLISTLVVAETATTFHLSRLSDQRGPKIVLLACTMALSVFMTGFGLSTTFSELVICQALIGAVKGLRGVTRSMLSRMIDSRDVARGIAYYETSWYLAGTIGSKIGGDLSNPVEQFPQLFGSIKFFKDYPYFLPCATCSILLLTGWLVAAALLRDTKDECVTEDGIKSTMRPLLLREYFAPGIIIAAVNYSSVCLIQMFRSSTEVLYLSTPIGDGGLGFSPSAIGTLASICAIATGLSHLFVFPRVHNKLGWRNIFVLGLIASVPLFVLWPVMNWIARKDGYSGWVWFALGVQILCYILNEFAWSKSFAMLIKSSHKCACSCNFGFYCPIVWRSCRSNGIL